MGSPLEQASVYTPNIMADIVFRFIIEYISLMDFGPYPIDLFLCEDF